MSLRLPLNHAFNPVVEDAYLILPRSVKRSRYSWSHVKEESSPKSEAHPTRQLDSLATSHFFSWCTFISRGVVLWFASYFSASLLGFFLSRRLIYFLSTAPVLCSLQLPGEKHCTCFEKTSTSQLCNCHSDLLSFRWPHGPWFHHLHSSELSHDSGLHCCLSVSWLLRHFSADWTYMCEK